MLHIGVDMHKRFSQVAVVDDLGQVLQEEHLEHRDRDHLAGFFAHYRSQAIAALEATRNWYWLYELIEAQGVQVKLVHPLRAKLIAEAKVKTDKIDARILAQMERAGFLPEAYIPPREIREQREWLRYRIALVHARAGFKNRVHTVLDKLGITHEYTDLFGKRGLEFLATVPLPEVYRFEVSEYLDIITRLDGKIAVVTKRIRQMLKPDLRARWCLSLPGVGDIITYLLLAEIGDIKRFPSDKKLVSYGGLAPGVRQSADHVWEGHITHQGNRYIRWGIIEAAQLAPKLDPALYQFYWRTARRRGPKKARVAVARKLLAAVWHVLTYEQEYRYNYMSKFPGPGKPALVCGHN
jgi:transposase